MPRPRVLWQSLLLATLTACGGSIASVGTTESDAQDLDASATPDDGDASSSPPDTATSEPDVSAPDTSTPDASAPDTSAPDTTAAETTAPDAACTGGSTVPGCPFGPPANGSCCPKGWSCGFVNECGTNYTAICTAAGWSSNRPSCGSACTTTPVDGAPCTGPVSCTFTSACGTASAICSASASYWAVMIPHCSGACPKDEPAKVGDPCPIDGKCSYASACGASDLVLCLKGVVTEIDVGACPACPATRPAPATACSSALKCSYVSACGGTDVATCAGAGSTWTVLRGACPP